MLASGAVTCRNCGRDLTGRRKGTVYCNHRCEMAYRRGNDPVELFMAKVARIRRRRPAKRSVATDT